MPVAVHLVEVLTLITALGILVAFTFFIVAADRILYLALLIVQPLSILFTTIMYKAEQILLWILNRILYVAGNVGTSLGCSSNDCSGGK